MKGVVWITGRPASGKSTLARELCGLLDRRSVATEVVDSDEVRSHLTPRPSYDAEERTLVYRCIAYVARRLSSRSVAVVAATAHSRSLQQEAEAICGRIFWVLADCSLEACEARDPKGLYREARRAPSSTLPGVGVPFEAPPDAFRVATEDRVPPEDLEALAAATTSWALSQL